MGNLHMMEVPVLSVPEAARQLRIPLATLKHWLEGGQRSGRRYEPVLREEPSGANHVTWGEMVEARYLRAYRTKADISMQQLRPFIQALRKEFGVPYPLAHFRPFVNGNRQLLLGLQELTGVPDDLWVVWRGGQGQVRLNPLISADFLDRVDFADSAELEALRIRPLGKDQPVILDPRLSSASATVHGVRTEVIAERVLANEALDDVAEEFRLSLTDVKAALAYEFEPAA